MHNIVAGHNEKFLWLEDLNLDRVEHVGKAVRGVKWEAQKRGLQCFNMRMCKRGKPFTCIGIAIQ